MLAPVKVRGNYKQLRINYMNWIKTKEKQPERQSNVRYSQVPCLVYYNGQVMILQFNHEHECWDDEDGDDYCCGIESVEFWMPLPTPPSVG